MLPEWNEQIARELAEKEGLSLTDDHWHVIHFLRNFYQQYQTMPTVRVLVNELRKIMGEKKGNSHYLHRLFPDGLMKQSARMAGLPKPTRCV